MRKKRWILPMVILLDFEASSPEREGRRGNPGFESRFEATGTQ